MMCIVRVTDMKFFFFFMSYLLDIDLKPMQKNLEWFGPAIPEL